MDFVAVDVGASNTRYLDNSRRINFVDNGVKFFPLDGKTNIDRLDGVLENNLDVTITKTGGDSKIFPLRGLVGLYGKRVGEVEYPDGLVKKIDQNINYFSAILAVALSKLKNESLGSTLNMFLALPPQEVVLARSVLRKELCGTYSVKFNAMPEVPEVVFTVNNIEVFEESRLAMLQFLFDPAHPDRMETYGNKTILSIDIGASTTDCVVFERGQYMNNKCLTIKHGGNDIRNRMMRNVMEDGKLNLRIRNEDADEAVMTGMAKSGSSSIQITDQLNKAKEDVAGMIVREISNYFSYADLPMTSIEYIIVSGGGSMESFFTQADGKRVKTSEPVSKYITDKLKKYSKDTAVIYFDDEPRMANIRGLGTYAVACNGEIKE